VFNLAVVSFASGADFDTFAADAVAMPFGNVSTNLRLRTLPVDASSFDLVTIASPGAIIFQ
jgi:hypothetical protein